VFRLGYGLDVRAPPRRPVDEVLRTFEAAPAPPPAARAAVCSSARGRAALRR
jgi:hypothetical protein